MPKVNLKFLPRAPKPKKIVKFPWAITEDMDNRRRLKLLEDKVDLLEERIKKLEK